MAEQDPPVENYRDTAQRPGPVARLLLLPIRIYRAVISPLLPPTCRFYPSCSAYAVEALTVHGAFRGSRLTLWRLLRCGPWHPGGLDPVPPRRRSSRRGSPDRGTTGQDSTGRDSTGQDGSGNTQNPRPYAEE
ncbi:membrane protein insertion efficiency factor YidD [Haloactinomyces albus]